VSGIPKTALGETVPPADPYATRTPPNPKKATKFSTLESFVQDAEADTQSTDWVQLVFHRVWRRRVVDGGAPILVVGLLPM